MQHYAAIKKNLNWIKLMIIGEQMEWYDVAFMVI